MHELFNSPAAPWVIGLVLFGFTAVFAYWWHGHWKRIQKVVLEVRDKLRLTSDFHAQEDHSRWNWFATEVYEDAKQSLALMANREPIAAQTLAFIQRCALVEDSSFRTWKLESALPVSEALDLRGHFLQHNILVPFYRAYPNYLVGAGLCITFFGLALVIGNAGDVLASANSGNSNEALRALLTAASTKFWSSLAAVALSILYGISFRWHSQLMERQLSLLARDLGQCVRVVGADELQYESVVRLRKCEEYQSITASGIGMLKSGLDSTQATGAEQHRLLLEKLQGVAEGFENKLGDLGAELGGKIGLMGNEVAKGLSQINEKAFADIVHLMTDTLHKATEVHLKSIADRLEKVSEMLGKLPDEFQALVGLVQENTTAIASSFAQAAKPIESSLASASLSAKEVAERFASLPNALEPARTAAHNLSGAASTISEMVGRIFSQNEAIMKRWEELSSLIQTVDSHLAGSVEKVGSVFPLYAEKLQTFTHKWETAMVHALESFAASLGTLTRSHEDLREHRGAWRESADSVARGMDDMKEQLGRFSETFTTLYNAQSCASPSLAPTQTETSTVEMPSLDERPANPDAKE